MPPKKKIVPKSDSNKDDKSNETDVTTARGRLMGALQGVIEGSGDESDKASDDSILFEDDPYVPASKLLKTPDSSVKRGKKREGATDLQSTYIMKLFDRSIDLAQFKENTPLYSVCRAWISNQGRTLKANKRVGSEPKPMPLPVQAPMIKREKYMDGDWDEHNPKDVLALPAPVKPYMSRVPPYMDLYEGSSKDNVELDYELNHPPGMADLFLEHRTRWVKVREYWHQHAAEVESRYRPSLQIIHSMYNKAQEMD